MNTGTVSRHIHSLRLDTCIIVYTALQKQKAVIAQFKIKCSAKPKGSNCLVEN